MSLKNYYLMLIFLMGMSLSFVSCNNDDDDDLIGDWEEVSTLNGKKRTIAAGFVIGDNGYVGTGFDEDKKGLKDFWRYDSEGDYWQQVASLPDEAIARGDAVGFSAAGKGFVGTGVDDDGNELKDFWMYEPSPVNTWTQIDDFPGTARYGAVAFALNDKGYVGTGTDEDGETKDFFEYNPTSGTWQEVLKYGGSKRTNGSVFVIGSKAYFVAGTSNKLTQDEFWVFDGSDWTRLRDISDSDDDEDYDDDYTSIVRTGAVAFTINGKGYLATGSNSSAVSNVWEYDPSTDLWTEKTSFQGGSRTDAVGFAIGSYGYITTGYSSGYYYDDLARFAPNEEDDEEY